MTAKKQHTLRIHLLLLLLILLAPLLKAQNNTDTRLIRLAWDDDRSVMRYEVEVEKAEEDGYRIIILKNTDVSLIELPLLYGLYRCRVTPFDFLGKPGKASEWVNFEVQPIIVQKPQEDEKSELIISYPEPEPENVPEPEPESIPEPAPENVPEPEPIIVFAEQSEDSIIASAPKRRKPVDIFISAAWAPVFPVYGEGDYLIGRDFSFKGASGRMGLLFTNIKFLAIGAEAEGTFHAYNYEDQTNYALAIGGNLLIQKKAPNQVTAITLRLGAGVDIFADSRPVHADIDLSFLWFPFTHFFLEAGFEYEHIFTGESPGAQPGCLRPHLGVGVQF